MSSWNNSKEDLLIEHGNLGWGWGRLPQTSITSFDEFESICHAADVAFTSLHEAIKHVHLHGHASANIQGQTDLYVCIWLEKRERGLKILIYVPCWYCQVVHASNSFGIYFSYVNINDIFWMTSLWENSLIMITQWLKWTGIMHLHRPCSHLTEMFLSYHFSLGWKKEEGSARHKWGGWTVQRFISLSILFWILMHWLLFWLSYLMYINIFRVYIDYGLIWAAKFIFQSIGLL